MRSIPLAACLVLGMFSFTASPRASAEIGIDLKLGGGKPRLEIKDDNSDSNINNDNSYSNSNNDNSNSSSNDDNSNSGSNDDNSDSNNNNSNSGSNDDNSNSNNSSVDGNYDPCFIHTDCKAGAGYSNNTDNSMGVGWYCKDGKPVNTNTSFDKCNIRKGCTSDKNYVGYVASSKSWECLEKAYIHKGCSSTPGFSSEGSLGAGWYCSDKKQVNQSTQFDPAAIKTGCSEQGSGIKFTDGIWRCN